MNKLSLLLAAFLLPAMLSFSTSPQTDKEDHVLTARWKAFYKAQNADKPKDQLAILEEIKKEALSQGLAWDYYDACDNYANVRVSINWKDREEARKAFANEIDTHAAPVARFFFYSNRDAAQACGIMETSRTELSAASHPQFWSRDYLLPSYMKELMANDYEYAQWHLFYAGGSPDALRAMYGERYPQAALIDYTLAAREASQPQLIRKEVAATQQLPSTTATSQQQPSQPQTMRELALRYKGKAVGYLAACRVLEADFGELCESDADHTLFRELLARCEQHEKERKTLSGLESKIAEEASVKYMIDRLKAKAISYSIKDGELTVVLRNLPGVKLELTATGQSAQTVTTAQSAKTAQTTTQSGKPVWAATLDNKARRFYVPDTLSCKLPVLDDGEYELTCSQGKEKTSGIYERYTIASSYRKDSRDMAFFAAHRISGQPLDKFTLIVLDSSGKELAREELSAQQGFTPLPKSLDKFFDSRSARRVRIACEQEGRKLLSRDIYISRNEPAAQNLADNPQNCLVLTDRSAFNPGETLHFKAVLYTGRHAYEVNPEGTELEAILADPSGKVLASSSLKTGEFGSAAGSFVIPQAQKGGYYRIRICKAGKDIGSARVRVDEFVLPTFELEWSAEDKDKLFFVGDTLRFRGSVKSYSGHALSAANISYELSCGFGSDPICGSATPAQDGSFEISCPAQAEGNYYLTLKLTDATGETLSFSTSRTVRSSIRIRSLALSNAARCDIALSDTKARCAGVLTADQANFSVHMDWNGDVPYRKTSISYKLLRAGSELQASSVREASAIVLDLKGLPSGLYELQAQAHAEDQSGRRYDSEPYKTCFAKLSPSEPTLPEGIASLFLEEEGTGVRVGVAKGPIWLVAELFGNGNILLAHKLVKLEGDGSVHSVAMDMRKDWPDFLSLRLLYFQNGREHSYSREISRSEQLLALPLSFTRFTDATVPGGRCSLAIGTEPGVECALAVFDKSSEVISRNEWGRVEPGRMYYPTVYYRNNAGADSSEGYGDSPVVYANLRLNAKTRAVMTSGMAVEESAPQMLDSFSAEAPEAEAEEVTVRSDFASTIAWAPCLRSAQDGSIEYSFAAGDKLYTFVVQLFAHNKNMSNAVLRREMLVTLPVKLAVVQPQFLVAGDRYGARVSLSNSLGQEVSGTLSCRFVEGSDYNTGRLISESAVPLSVPAGDAVSESFGICAPSGADTLGMLITFRPAASEQGSDAVFVTIPLHPAAQTITEAHSAVLLAGADREALMAKLRVEFVNVPGSDAKLSEQSILQMLQEAIPACVEPGADDAFSLVRALYSNFLARKLGARGLDNAAREALLAKLMACHNADGGFGWFEGMTSSPVVTAVVMEDLARMAAKGWETPDNVALALSQAAVYLDGCLFGRHGSRPMWCGAISLQQYIYVRSLYAATPFEHSSATAKELRDFRKQAKAYLLPAAKRGLNGQILAKLRRVSALSNLAASDEGIALAKAWGLGAAAGRNLRKSAAADIRSELQYLVPHWAGGSYYPNAVMPFRGLLESELYAHVMLCDMLQDHGYAAEADGIRLWMMIQKETQKWGSDPAYVEAIGCVMDGGSDLLATRVMALTASATLPLGEVRAAGNDMSVERVWSVRRGGSFRPLAEGEVLSVGDELMAEYRIWNRENRSFVMLTAPRPAAFRPADQLSGHYGWWMRPLEVQGWCSFSPQGYRSVFADRSEYRFDTYPEEKTSICERFFVTQEGEFHMPAASIECLYAPHYRANDAASAPVMVKP